MSKDKKPLYVIEPCTLRDIEDICSKYHKYGSVGGNIHTHRYAVIENASPVAVYAWMPANLGTANNVCPEFPQGVLSLSRMCAVPKSARKLKHISKPLRHQMKNLIDRTRYPVLITYSDAGDPKGNGRGHNGFTYQCSGWTKKTSSEVPYFEDEFGNRLSSYSKGKKMKGVKQKGMTVVTRWENWACPRGQALEHVLSNGWERVQMFKKNGEPKVWRSGNFAFQWKLSSSVGSD